MSKPLSFLAASGCFGRGDAQELSLTAISLSAAPVSARLAGAAPVCAAAVTAPRCGRGSNSKERICSGVEEDRTGQSLSNVRGPESLTFK